MTSTRKDTIYIDVDDEITSIIEKVRSSPQKIVALVLPKRAAVLQSIVNMKLLTRSADDAKKHLVLITSEAGLLPLAGVVGVHVAKTLQSKPAIPPTPVSPDAKNDTPDTVSETIEDAPVDATKPVGELAGLPITGEEETIEVDNDTAEAAAPAKAGAKTKKANKSLKIPNFKKFRTRLILGVVAFLLLLVGWYVASFVMPRANVVIRTDTENISSTVKFTSNPAVAEFDEENTIVPAQTKELKKTEGQKAPATGQKNTGQKATGTVRLVNCSQADKLSDTIRTVPAGTAISSGGLTFILAKSVEVEPSSFIGNVCQKNKKSSSTDVTAQHPGDNYNLSARDYQVAGFASITAQGSDMEGGTNNLVKVVSQEDVDNLRQKIIDGFTSNAKEELKQQFIAEGLIPLEDTFSVGQPVAVSTPNVNDEAAEVTVNVTMSFTMQGVEQDHIKKLIENSVKDEIDAERQSILDHGLGGAIFQINERKEDGSVSYSLQTLVVAGPEINQEGLKQEIAGKKLGETERIIESQPGVKEAVVDYSPFWVSKTPRKPSKVNVIIESTNQDQDADNSE